MNMQLCLEKPQIVSLTLFSHFSSLLLSFTLPGSERAYYTTHAADGAHLTSHKHSHTHAHTASPSHIHTQMGHAGTEHGPRQRVRLWMCV